jgi:hypothetical protein
MEKLTLLELHLDEAAFSVTNNAPGSGVTASETDDAAADGAEDEDADANANTDADGSAAGIGPGGGPPKLLALLVLVAVLVALARALGGSDEELDDLAALDEESA